MDIANAGAFFDAAANGDYPTDRGSEAVPTLTDSDIAARGRAWLAHIERGKSAGFGIVIVPDDYILTNEHVVHELLHVDQLDRRRHCSTFSRL